MVQNFWWISKLGNIEKSNKSFVWVKRMSLFPIYLKRGRKKTLLKQLINVWVELPPLWKQLLRFCWFAKFRRPLFRIRTYMFSPHISIVTRWSSNLPRLQIIVFDAIKCRINIFYLLAVVNSVPKAPDFSLYLPICRNRIKISRFLSSPI